MPPKAKITREMVVDAAFEIAREKGVENINARTVSEKLSCSTQPVMYHFKTIEELKKTVYQKADAYHAACIQEVHGENPLQEIGLNYIRFAATEKHLFRFLFQSGEFSGSTIIDLVNAEEIRPVIEILAGATGLNMEQAKAVFRTVFLCVHGYASMLANNDMPFAEESIATDLTLVLYGAIGALKESEDSQNETAL